MQNAYFSHLAASDRCRMRISRIWRLPTDAECVFLAFGGFRPMQNAYFSHLAASDRCRMRISRIWRLPTDAECVFLAFGGFRPSQNAYNPRTAAFDPSRTASSGGAPTPGRVSGLSGFSASEPPQGPVLVIRGFRPMQNAYFSHWAASDRCRMRISRIWRLPTDAECVFLAFGGFRPMQNAYFSHLAASDRCRMRISRIWRLPTDAECVFLAFGGFRPSQNAYNPRTAAFDPSRTASSGFPSPSGSGVSQGPVLVIRSRNLLIDIY